MENKNEKDASHIKMTIVSLGSFINDVCQKWEFSETSDLFVLSHMEVSSNLRFTLIPKL
jgi:hypothetical protein